MRPKIVSEVARAVPVAVTELQIRDTQDEGDRGKDESEKERAEQHGIEPIVDDKHRQPPFPFAAADRRRPPISKDPSVQPTASGVFHPVYDGAAPMFRSFCHKTFGDRSAFPKSCRVGKVRRRRSILGGANDRLTLECA